MLGAAPHYYVLGRGGGQLSGRGDYLVTLELHLDGLLQALHFHDRPVSPTWEVWLALPSSASAYELCLRQVLPSQGDE